MSVMTGIVEQVSTKDVTTKFGVKPTFSLKVNGGWVKCGFKNPMVNVGDEIQFDGEAGAYGMEAKGIVVIAKGKGAAAPVVPSSKPTGMASGYGSRVFPIPPLHGDRSIVRQNALARATDLLIHSGGGKTYEVNDKLVDYIIKIARHFEAYTAGDLDLAEATKEVAADASPVAKKAATPKPLVKEVEVVEEEEAT